MTNADKHIIEHIGTKRHSGRYPWGTSGYGVGSGLLNQIEHLQEQGLSEVEISKSLEMSTTELREIKSIEKSRARAAQRSQALRLKDKGVSNVAIGERLGINESTVRSLLDPVLHERSMIIDRITDFFKNLIKKKGPIDVGAGVESSLGISRTKLNAAVRNAERQGYNVYYIQTPQLTTGHMTSIKVLAPPDMTYQEVYKNRSEIGTITERSPDNGRSFLGLKPIQSVSADRVQIVYKSDKDGLIELRPGREDLDLGNSQYAQVRIGVDDSHFLKGMAVYGDKFPDGADILYHTNKASGDPKDIFKEMTGDPDNQFGATIKAGGQQGALNIVYEEGDWNQWSRTISSQVLSKQRPTLARRQLELDSALRQEEYTEIMSVTNPVVRKKLLEAFSDQCDAAAVNLKAASLPRQSSHVLLPVPGLKETEVYAPMFRNGEQVALIRHPHGGIFEIPEVVVNNKSPEAKRIMGNAVDAIGINPSVARKLSGADFDGDTVIVIPNERGHIKSAPALSGLKNFDPRESYPGYSGMPKMSSTGTALHMGNVTNLITDMTIKGASQDELARAVRHSMVIIDAEKHGLNYRQSAIDNGISALKTKYQGSSRQGASTIVSRASAQKRIPHREPGEFRIDPETGKLKRFYIDPTTGEKLYSDTGYEYVSPSTGKTVQRQTISTQMAEAKSAYELSSGTTMETVYAKYADTLKGLANKARRDMVNTPNLKYDPDAKISFKDEVSSLDSKIRIAERNRPLERKAQLVADFVYRSKLKDNPNMEQAHRKRLKDQALIGARIRLGAKKPEIELTDNEWTAFDIGAISHNKALTILRYADLEKIKEHAMPRVRTVMTDIKIARAKMMSAAGYTPAEIASALGVSASTIVTTLE